MDNALREAKFEDGTELILMPCLLRLTIGEESFAAHALRQFSKNAALENVSESKEGRRETEIVWCEVTGKHRVDRVLDEDKHKYSDTWCPSDKRGDIQLIANILGHLVSECCSANKPVCAWKGVPAENIRNKV